MPLEDVLVAVCEVLVELEVEEVEKVVLVLLSPRMAPKTL